MNQTLIMSILGRLNNPRLESAYQKYSHRQRQKSVILVNLIDLIVKLVILVTLLIHNNLNVNNYISYGYIIFLSVSISLNMILSLLPCYSRCYANNYLHWGAAATWILLTSQGCYQVVLVDKKCSVFRIKQTENFYPS